MSCDCNHNEESFPLVACLECGREFKRITNTHLEGCCGMSIENYKENHPDALIESKELAMSRVDHLRGKSYEEVYGEEKAQELKSQRVATTTKDWEENEVRLEVQDGAIQKIEDHRLKREAENWRIGRKRIPENYGEAICLQCEKIFGYRIGESKGKFCSQTCNGKYKTAHADGNYRVKVLDMKDWECERCTKELEKSEIYVHHADGDNWNNDLDNLMILCSSCHGEIHTEMRKANHVSTVLPGVAAGMKSIIKGLKLDWKDPNFRDTPKRVAKAYQEILEGSFPAAEEEIKHHLSRAFPCDNDEMVIIKGIIAWSMCPHHFLPVKYRISIGYLPSDKVLGLSKLPRLAILLAKRPVLQEQLTQDIVKYLEEILEPRGAGVFVEGIHMCMQMRGVRALGSSAVTSYMTGAFKENMTTKSEFMSTVMDQRELTL